MYVAARIPLAGLASHRAGAVHLTEPEEVDAADCSGGISFGGAAQAEKIAKIERETIEMQLKTRALFKFVLLLFLYICVYICNNGFNGRTFVVNWLVLSFIELLPLRSSPTIRLRACGDFGQLFTEPNIDEGFC